jgi:hypothetical protein
MMTTDQTTRQTTRPNVGDPDVVARPAAAMRCLWSCKALGALALVAAATVFTPSCAVSGSERTSAAAEGPVRTLSPATIEALRKDTGVDPLYALVFDAKGAVVIGQPPNVRITNYNSEQELWESQGKVSVQSVTPTAFVRFQRNPIVQCFPYSAFGSIRWYCIEIPG